MTQVQMTAADVTDADMHTFSDMWKECYNFRPRFTPTKQDFADLSNRYDSLQEDNRIEEERYLQSLRDEHGQEFDSMMDYYNWWEAQEAARYELEQAEKRHQATLKVPGIPAVIDRWEHGDY